MDEEKGVFASIVREEGTKRYCFDNELSTSRHEVGQNSPCLTPYTEVMMRSLVKCNFACPKYNHVSFVEIHLHQYCCNTTTAMLFKYNHINVVEI